MADSVDKFYVSAICKASPKFGDSIIDMSIDVASLKKAIEEHQTEKNGSFYLALKVVKRREIGKHGDSHYLQVNTWKPDAQTNSEPKSNTETQS